MQYLSAMRVPPDGASWKERPVAANREKAFLATCYRVGLTENWLDDMPNPCAGVKRNRERGATALPRNSQVRKVLEQLREYHRDLLRLIEITGARPSDLRLLEWSEVHETASAEDIEDGLGPRIEYLEDKTSETTGKTTAIHWSPGVDEIIQRAKARRDMLVNRATEVKSSTGRVMRTRAAQDPKYVFVNFRGQPISQGWIGKILREKKAGFTSQQLRPKAHTAGKADQDNPRNMLGHTGGMDRRYTRRNWVTPLA